MSSQTFEARFSEDRDFADAVSFRFVVIGEAIAALLRLATQESERVEQLASWPIDWGGFVALRNVLAHQYFRREPN